MVLNVLREWRVACPRQGDTLRFVFPNTRGTPMHITDLSRLLWNPLAEKCGLGARDAKGKFTAKYDFRHLRHVAASLFIATGATPKRIQEIMGHSSIRVTYDIYGHLFNDDAADQRWRSRRNGGCSGELMSADYHPLHNSTEPARGNSIHGEVAEIRIRK